MAAELEQANAQTERDNARVDLAHMGAELDKVASDHADRCADVARLRQELAWSRRTALLRDLNATTDNATADNATPDNHAPATPPLGRPPAPLALVPVIRSGTTAEALDAALVAHARSWGEDLDRTAEARRAP